MTTLPQTTAIRVPRTMPAPLAVGAPPPWVTPAAQQHLSAADVWRILRQNIWMILVVLVLSAVVGFFLNMYLAQYHARYTARGWIEIQPPPSLSLITDMRPQNLDTNALSHAQRTQATLILQEGLLLKVLSNQHAEIRNTAWFKSFGGNAHRAVEDLLDGTLRVEAVKDTFLVSISASYRIPQDSKVIVEEIVDQHVEDRRQANTIRILDRSRMLSQRRQRYQFQLNDIRTDLRDRSIRLSIDGMGVPGRLSTREIELKDLMQRQFELQSAVDEASGAYESALAQISEGAAIPAIQDQVDIDPHILQLRNQILNIDMALAQTTLGPGHKRVKELIRQREVVQATLDDMMASSRAKLTASYLERLRSARDASEIARKQVMEAVNITKGELGDLTHSMSQYLAKKDEEKTIQDLLNEVNKQLDDIQQIETQRDVSGVVWAQRPTVPEIPSFPKLPITMAVTITLGLALAVTVAFLREMMDTTVRSPQDIARVGQLTLLGIVPHEDDDPQVAGAPLPLVIFQAPHSVLAEQYRQVRSRLQHAASLETTRSILVTSPGPGDGKTTAACNLGAGMALNGRRVLLVDGNFRRPELHRVFSLANDTGFSSALASINAFGSAVCQTQVPNLDVMPSGPRPVNATELLESQLFTEFIDRALEEYDNVIFDSGPLLFVSESMAIAPRVDGVVSVVRARTNTRGLLQRLRDTLKQAKAENLGVILNAVRSQAGGYYNRNIKTYYAYSNGNGA